MTPSWFVHVVENDVNSVKQCLFNGVDVNEMDESNGNTALLIAVENRQIEMIQMLLTSNQTIDVNHMRLNNETALSVACIRAESAEIIKILIEAGAHTERAVSHFRLPPLCLATYFGHLENVVALLPFCPIEGGSITNRWPTPLQIAVDRGHTAIARVLISAGANVDAVRYRDCITPLMVAAERGDLDLIRCLLLGGADVNRLSKRGRTALSYVRMSTHIDRHLVERELIAAQLDDAPHNASTDFDPSRRALYLWVHRVRATLLDFAISFAPVGLPVLPLLIIFDELDWRHASTEWHRKWHLTANVKRFYDLRSVMCEA